MPISLFVEHHANSLAFYLNGDLQFDTADEASYHENLVVPAVALAVHRFPQTDLRVLICGGGDGLAARDVWRFPEVSHIDLVDYSAEVIELGKTIFKPYNKGSLEREQLTVHVQEALEFISGQPAQYYHIVICDFTYPTGSEDTRIYSLEWFKQVRRVLYPEGVMSSNGVSPENSTNGFWCLYQTLLAAELIAKPLQVNIPSFHRHGYGNWGFFLAAVLPFDRSDLEAIALPKNLQALTRDGLLQAFVFEEGIAKGRHNVMIHTLECPQLFYYLLNPTDGEDIAPILSQPINFLDMEESGTYRLGMQDLLQLESIAQVWLEQIYSKTPTQDSVNLLPVQHRYHSPKMTKEWLMYLKQLWSEIDILRLLNSLLERSHELPPKLARDLKELSEKIRTDNILSNLPPSTAEFVTILSVTLLMANVVTPDAVFAKGYYPRSSGSTYYQSGSTYYDSYSPWSTTQVWGAAFAAIGLSWLVNILSRIITNNTDNE